ncbi:hypothetical protein [Marinigracilibium pacificum]|uniref:Outer membrane protein beta-barrel domain-containing protein n=1 Tax=Marinigracilibium pacificum TaxID=2729599 RepID=A0A848J0E9_9BACT|nr:hypothetical protein [Marinigracilibium pacificum]NMM47954.1 hypothetical protein [Marinigracilibium pacificum]
MRDKDNLEDIFKKGLSYEPTDFRESDWEKMVEKIEQSPEQRVNKWKTISLFLSGVIVLLLMYIGFRELNIINNYEPSASKISADGKVSDEALVNGINNSDNNIIDSVQASFSLSQKEMKGSEINIGDKESAVSNSNDKSANSNSISNIEKQNQGKSGYYHDQSKEGIIISNSDDHNRSEGEYHGDIGDSKVVSGNSVNIHEASSGFVYTRLKPIHYTGKIHENPQMILVGKTASTIKVNEEKQVVHPAISVAAYYAADMSTVNFKGFDKFSDRMGFSIFLNVTNKWSIETGANISTKYYWAGSGNYTTGGYYKDPDKTYGTCEVLDIPLNVRYYFDNKGKTKWFVTTGISSWLMLEEEYEYYYNYNQYENPTGWYGENENYHWFGVLNLEVGLERSLSKRWSVSAIPYFNLPLKGVGNGQVRLISNGLKVALKFN